MAAEQGLEEFNKDHPHPDIAGIKSLFKFFKFDEKKIQHLSDLFISGKLYHSQPTRFNDPFECKPHFNWPNSPSKVKAIREHLVKVAKERGHTRKSAQALISKNMAKPEFIRETIYNSIQKTFSEIRICSFTTNKENLLFWSHYADSHKGFCVEFDASKLPFSYAFKVRYKDEYPEVTYPSPPSVRGFRPALVKSKAWEYEEEYRIVFVPEALQQPKNDGESLILNGSEIKHVYFGACMASEHKDVLVDLIGKGPFDPSLWDVSLSKSSFKLVFSEHR